MPPEFNRAYLNEQLGMTANIIMGLDLDRVRVVDLDLARNLQAERERTKLGLAPQPPLAWESYYNGLNPEARGLLGNVIRALIRNNFGPSTLRGITSQPLSRDVFRDDQDRQIAERVFGIKFEPNGTSPQTLINS